MCPPKGTGQARGPVPGEGLPSFRRKPESIFTPFAFSRGSHTSAGNETPSFIHPRPQMDSGFRRNDDRKRRAKPPSRTGRRPLGHRSLEVFFNNPRRDRSRPVPATPNGRTQRFSPRKSSLFLKQPHQSGVVEKVPQTANASSLTLSSRRRSNATEKGAFVSKGLPEPD